MNDIAIDYDALEGSAAEFTDSAAQRTYALHYLGRAGDAGIGAPAGDSALGAALAEALATHVSSIGTIDGTVTDLVRRMQAIVSEGRRMDGDAAAAMDAG